MSRRDVVVMLPGAQFAADDFVVHGFVDALASRYPEVEAVVAAVPQERYLDGDVGGFVWEEVLAPMVAQGRVRLFLLGVSLGGMGALLTARAGAVSGLFLLSPFIGTRGAVAAVAGAGGLDAWTPPAVGPGDVEIGLLAWLKGRPFDAAEAPVVRLGCGRDDRFAAASEILAARVARERVWFVDGGHDWPTWERLWHIMLQDDPFGRPACGRGEGEA